MSGRREDIVRDAIERSYDDDPNERRLALHDLCPCQVKADFPDAWARVMELTADPVVAVRKQALHNLCDGSPPAYLPDVVHTLEWMAQDPDARVRRMATHVLRHYRRTGVVNIL